MEMKILHVVPGLDNPFNGIAVAAKLIAGEQGAEIVDAREFGKIKDLTKYEEVWVHSCWLPVTLKACWRVVKAKRPLVRMTHANLDPVRLRSHGWKKWLVGPIERWILRRCAKIVATCDAEKEWIEAYLGKKCPEVEIVDLKRFFNLAVSSQRLAVSEGELAVSGQRLAVSGDGLAVSGQSLAVSGDGCNSELDTRNRELHVLYLGRRHPLKGVEFLEAAVSELNSSTPPLPTPPLLKIVSNAFGEELEKVWDWCDVLVLPTLSENFGLVVAEALERGKRVITTDGAPVWGEESDGVEEWVSGGVECRYGGRLLYLNGYRDGSEEERVELLKKAILFLAAKNAKGAKGLYD